VRILFVHNSLRSFVRTDRDIFSAEHDVDEMDLSAPHRISTLPIRLAQADLVYSWWASLHSFLPVLSARATGKPAITVVGGYDVANVSEIGFGHMAHPWKRHVVRSICASSTLLVTHSVYAESAIYKNVGTTTPVRLIYLGFDLPNEAVNPERRPIVLSVGLIRRENLQRKGHEVFARAAALVPHAKFMLVGRCLDDAGEYLRSIAAPNLTVTGHLPQSDLDDLFQQASVYVQASAQESFGAALAEAMGAGCIPVVSRQGALPEVVGDSGLWIDEKDPQSLATAIERGLSATLQEREAAASRVRDLFPLSARREALLDVVMALAPGKA
jgi:glycosyltransferase involved in cell wall biosynthesis